VLAVADAGLSTPAVYGELDRMRTGRHVATPVLPEGLLAALRRNDVEQIAYHLANDLQAAACSLRPALHDVLEAGRAGGAAGGIVSGSGPTVLFLAHDAPAARRLADDLVASGTCVAAVPTQGAAAGARLVSG
jgi:4-diphosphocytidyl-2-C-methyl-D-erythritol kinase